LPDTTRSPVRAPATSTEKIRFVGTVEEFQSQLGGQPLPEDLIPTVKENLGEQGHTDEEIEAIISALS